MEMGGDQVLDLGGIHGNGDEGGNREARGVKMAKFYSICLLIQHRGEEKSRIMFSE